MPGVRRLLGAVAVAFLVCAGMVAPPAAAQDTAVSLRLVSQSPWVLGYKRGTLDLELSAFNGGSTPLRNLRLAVSFGAHTTTQGEFEGMLSTGVTSVIASDTKDVPIEIGPGEAPRPIQMHVDMKAIDAIDPSDSQVYPALVQLLSESGTVVASLVTPVIYLVNEPVAPMLLSTWVKLSAPIAFGADGTLVDATFPTAIAELGALRAPLDAIAATTGGRNPHGVLDLALDPLLIAQARDLLPGYRLSDGTTIANTDPSVKEAKKFLHKLTTATARTDTLETIALPYTDPVLPAMLASGLGTQLSSERDAGEIIVESLNPALASTVPTRTIALPNDGRLSDPALDWLSGEGANIVLGNADTVDRSPYQGTLAPAPTVPMSSGTMILPDPTTQALFDRTDLLTDPVRAAQIVLGELAVIWKQQPAPTAPTQRGIALAPPPTLPPDLWAPLLSRLSDAPFLKPVTATQLVQQVHPDETNVNEEAPLAAPDSSQFEPDYAAAIEDLTRAVDAYGSMLPSGDQIPTDLRRRLFLATAPAYLIDPAAGQPWLDSVNEGTSRAFNAVHPAVSTSTAFTFTSREGTIPIQMGDPGPTPLHVIVELQSTGFTFLDPPGNPQDVTLQQPGQEITFDVVAEGSGQSTMFVIVRAPDGQEISRQTITVRSTAVNRIALIITAGAALGLVALYARRWFRRRKRAAT